MKLGLRVKFIITFSLLIFFSSVLLSGFLIRKQAELITNKLKDKGKYLARSLASSAEYGVLVEDPSLLYKLLGSVRDDEDVAHVVIQGKENNMLASLVKSTSPGIPLPLETSKANEVSRERTFQKKVSSGKKAVEGFYEFSFPVTSIKTVRANEEVSLGATIKKGEDKFGETVERIGTVRVWISTERMRKQISEMKNMVLLLTIEIVCFGILLVSILVGIIMNPLEKLVEATKKVAIGDFSSQVVVKQNDEI